MHSTCMMNTLLVNILTWKLKVDYSFSGTDFMLINVTICLQTLRQKSDSLVKYFR